MGDRCPVCDRDGCTGSGGLEYVEGSKMCRDHAVDWKGRALAAEAEVATMQRHAKMAGESIVREADIADWLSTMAEECARQADSVEVSSEMLMRMGDEALVFNRLHDEALRERDQLRKDIAHLTQQAGEDSCADQVRRRIEAEAERDAAMLYHARDWAMTERLVRLNEGACMADGLRELYPEHADRLLTKDNP